MQLFRLLRQGLTRRWLIIWNDCWHDATPERSRAGLAQVFAGVLAVLMSFAASRYIFPPKPPRLLPAAVREQVAECILSGDPAACATMDKIRGASAR